MKNVVVIHNWGQKTLATENWWENGKTQLHKNLLLQIINIEYYWLKKPIFL